jgi:hypothetical protein
MLWILNLFILFSGLFSSLCSYGAVNDFDDADLQTILTSSAQKKGQRYIIYSWSPHMSLSIRGLNELTNASNRTQPTVLVVLDPDANLELATEIAKKQKWPSEFLRLNRSEILFKRGIRIHYPSYNLISNGSFRGRLLPGYKTRTELEDFQKRHYK